MIVVIFTMLVMTVMVLCIMRVVCIMMVIYIVRYLLLNQPLGTPIRWVDAPLNG